MSMQPPSALNWRTVRTVALAGPVLAMVCAATPAQAQQIICCNQLFNVGGSWVGASRIADCQKYLNQAPRSTAVLLCKKRMDLVCIDTSRCNEFPPEEIAPDGTSDASLPPDPDRDGLEQGFFGPSLPTPPLAPAGPQAGSRRLVYLIKGVPGGGKPVTAFTVFLDGVACLMPIDANNRPADPAAAKYVVRGRITRGDGRVRIDADAQELARGTKLGPVTGEANGEDTAAVAKAAAAVATGLKLVCRR